MVKSHSQLLKNYQVEYFCLCSFSQKEKNKSILDLYSSSARKLLSLKQTEVFKEYILIHIKLLEKYTNYLFWCLDILYQP